MTSKLTRERLAKIKSWRETYGAGSNVMLPSEEAEELACLALAAMGSEPVAEVLSNRPGNGTSIVDVALPVGTQLYRHAQPASVVDADDNFYSWFGMEWAENYQHNQYTTAAKQMLGVMAESAWIAATERQRQKQSVSVPDVKMHEDVPYEVGRLKTHRDCYCDGWNACRAAMLQASPVCTCPSGDGSLRWPCPVHPGNSPAQSDCCPAQNHVSPEQNGDTPAKNQGWIPVSEQMPPSRHEVLVGRWWGEKPRWCCKWATYIPGHPDAQSSGWLIPGGSWTPTHWMELPTAPQEVKGE
ncbi:DUF551 domain-containing protein [Klebsiella quasipneumoniae]|uniref:DUF551 domain-containing protein n=1 Tax=Klebsiella quasipneumoniae TaxID=1463165 RepID=UPI00237CD681|nr:DUF551 domain-containing protein [Klebsiella quasipneumoniae]MDE1587375.1 DUF551 domain-containing protein [Klebsiella quasipneumoniae]MDE1598119.1 DUF551 domain-containing protein [Klebsiella quasipneumoniae]MDE1603404.1 DUF551 domain-containing protein [Klebsiella quasipneumoniae]MDE1608702.1 DUF551 domain-containing protein [Klebsiella quasipneumoniae]MDE1614116.1 DUF551 domain-containing protein [Klebsiella quasipneumoniae]